VVAITPASHGKDKIKPFYPVALIDSLMRKDAWAVCRDFRQEFELHTNGKAVEHVHLVITVLGKRGDDLAELSIPYDQTSKITSISGKNYTAEGIYDEKLKSGAIQDVNYTAEGAIYDDLRMKIAKIDSNTYPYTVEYNYDIAYNGLLGYPTWRPLNEYHFSVEKSSFIFIYPENMVIRYREKNLPNDCRTEKTEKGVRIPMHTATQSLQCRKANVSITAEGGLEAMTVTNFTGYQYDNISGILTESKKEQEKALYENLAIAGLKISDFTYQESRKVIPEATQSIALTSQTFATRSGTRIYVPVNIFNRIKSIPDHVDNRKMPVYREFGFLDTDSVTFQLPKGYKPESVPCGKTLKSAFGEYCSTLTVKDDKVLYTRLYKMNPGTWP
jgi:hypothetical protein